MTRDARPLPSPLARFNDGRHRDVLEHAAKALATAPAMIALLVHYATSEALLFALGVAVAQAGPDAFPVVRDVLTEAFHTGD